jgi:hypothetical protein
MQLVSRLKIDRGGRYPECVSEESQTLIIEWCQQHGPLGVLLSRWEAIRLAEVRNPSGEASQTLFSRGFGREVQSNTLSGDGLDLKPRVFMRDWNDLKLNEEPPRRTWARFFPGTPTRGRDRFQYPRPYTNKFCRLYGEPLSDFCRAAVLLTNAILLLGQKRKPDSLAYSQVLYSLNVLRKPIDSLLDFDDQWNPALRWTSPSLLASFAEMFVQDLMRGQAILICKSCGDPFTAQAYQSLYCGKACGFRQQKRRQRQQFRDLAKLRGQGRGVRQIAAVLKQEPSLIKSRLEKLRKLTGPKRDVTRL